MAPRPGGEADKLGNKNRHVRYDVRDVLAWVQEHRLV